MSDYLSIQKALLTNDIGIVKKVLKDVSKVNDTGGTGINALHYYISVSSQLKYAANELIQILIESGIDINAQNSEGNAPLHFAVGSKDARIVKILVEKNVLVDIQNNTGNTPLWRAVQDFRGEQSLLEIIKVLMSASANPDLKNNHGHSPRSIVIDRHDSMQRTKKPKEWDLQPHLHW